MLSLAFFTNPSFIPSLYKIIACSDHHLNFYYFLFCNNYSFSSICKERDIFLNQGRLHFFTLASCKKQYEFTDSIFTSWRVFRARFYAAEIASAIGYLHALSIIYRYVQIVMWYWFLKAGWTWHLFDLCSLCNRTALFSLFLINSDTVSK